MCGRADSGSTSRTLRVARSSTSTVGTASVVAPEKLVYSFLFGDMPEGDGFVEITLVEKDGVTELRDRGVFNSKEERDAVIASGMEVGARETYERLSELIATRVA